MKEEIRKIIETRLKKNGIGMYKKISAGSLFSDSVYDNRRVYTLEDMFKLNKEGFFTDENLGLFLWNAFLTD